MAIHHAAPLSKRVRFSLPCDHVDRNSTNYCHCCPLLDDRTQLHLMSLANLQQHAICNPTPPTTTLGEGVLNGMIPSAVSDTGATSHALLPSAPSIPTGIPSKVVFHLLNGTTTVASTVNKLLHNVWEPTQSANIVPTLANNSLISTSKFVEAGYTIVYNNKEVNYYEKATTKIIVSEDAVLQGWRCPRDKLWHVPLIPDVRNLNTDTILLDHPLGHSSLHVMYEVANMTLTCQHINAISLLAHQREYIHNIYELPSLEPAICYLHASAGFPPKPTWLKAIQQGNYSTWPLINVKNIPKYFPESEETQMGHMRGQRQGIRSTCPVDAPGTTNDANSPNITVPVSNPTPTAHTVAHDVLIWVIDLKDTMYMYQTGCFPFVSSLGNCYIMILHHVDSNSSWSKALKNNSKGKLILARRCALIRMAQHSIVPRHQILDNQALFAYKTEIELPKMTYELVPPDDHCCNLAKKAIQTFKDHMEQNRST